jgi:hypothetical protein
MSAQGVEEQRRRLDKLSDALFGEAPDVDRIEAEELLRVAGIDPEKLTGGLYQRMLEKAQGYTQAKKPLPPLLEQAVEDLRTAANRDENELARTARAAMARLLEEIKRLPTLLERYSTPTFTAAYRKKKQLSARDTKLLDGAADDLQKRVKGPKGK